MCVTYSTLADGGCYQKMLLQLSGYVSTLSDDG